MSQATDRPQAGLHNTASGTAGGPAILQSERDRMAFTEVEARGNYNIKLYFLIYNKRFYVLKCLKIC